MRLLIDFSRSGEDKPEGGASDTPTDGAAIQRVVAEGQKAARRGNRDYALAVAFALKELTPMSEAAAIETIGINEMPPAPDKSLQGSVTPQPEAVAPAPAERMTEQMAAAMPALGRKRTDPLERGLATARVQDDPPEPDGAA